MILFPESWKIDIVETLCKEITDCINKTAPVVEYETQYLMIRTTNVKEGRVNLEGARYVDEATYRKWTRRLKPRRNDIVLTREAPLGDVGLVRTDVDIFLGQRTMVYRADNKELSQRFLYYTLLGSTLQAQIKMFGSGSTVEHMRVPDSKKLEIPYPPLPIQRKIAAVLSAYDDLIENNNRRIAILEKIAEELCQEWFVRLRFPGHDKVRIVKGVPEGWEIIPAKKLFTIVKGRSYKSDEIADYQINEEYKNFITLKNFMRNGGYRESDRKFYKGKYTEEQIVFGGDIIMAVTDMTQDRAVVGRVAYIPKNSIENGIISCDVIKLSPKRISAELLYTLLRYSSYSESLKEYANGANVLHLKPEMALKQNLLFPSENVLNSFEERILSIYSQKDFIYNTISYLKTSRDRLLSRLMSGKIDVENLDIQFPESMQEEIANA